MMVSVEVLIVLLGVFLFAGIDKGEWLSNLRRRVVVASHTARFASVEVFALRETTASTSKPLPRNHVAGHLSEARVVTLKILYSAGLVYLQTK